MTRKSPFERELAEKELTLGLKLKHKNVVEVKAGLVTTDNIQILMDYADKNVKEWYDEQILSEDHQAFKDRFETRVSFDVKW